MTPNPSTPATHTAADDAPLMLGVSGLRGVTGKSLSDDVVRRYARAIAGWAFDNASLLGVPHNQPPTVIVGRDGRAGGAALVALAVRELAAAGCHVIDCGIATTPTVGVVCDSLRAHVGVICTASHNPQQWNGLKCLARLSQSPADPTRRACAPPADLAAQIVARFTSGQATPDRPGGSSRAIDPLSPTPDGAPAHPQLVVRSIENLLGSLKPIRDARFVVALDSVNSSGAPAADALLRELGCVIHQIAGDGSGLFPHTPEPLEENLASLRTHVTAHAAAVGLAQDPDADRLALVDETGRYIGEEKTLALCALAVLSLIRPTDARRATLAANLSTSRMIDDVAHRFGARVLRSAVGEANVVERMRLDGCVLGGEGNGGVIWPVVTSVRDSLSAAALVLALMARTAKPLSALADSLPNYSIVKRKQPLARREDAHGALRALAHAWRSHAIDTQDGVRADIVLPDGSNAWIHVRPSNTEPILRAIAEAPTQQQATRLIDEASKIMAS